MDAPVKHYSSGMYVRLAFAVAAHPSSGSGRRLEPEILLVDEVLAVGDAAFQKKCLGKMAIWQKKGGRCYVVKQAKTKEGSRARSPQSGQASWAAQN